MKRSLLATSFGVALLLIAALGIVGYFDAEEEQRQQDEYCEMVKLWKQTNGQAGWPAYNGEGMCK